MLSFEESIEKGGIKMILDGIILTSTSYLNKERSISAIFHIITGKKSIQTVQDIHMYQLKSFYGVYPSLDKAVFQKQIRYLIKEDCLRICNEEKQIYKLTPVGSRRLNEVGESSTLKLLNGFRFAGLEKIYFDRLRLLLQTLINSRMGNFNFIPVIENKEVEVWVKWYYIKIKPTRSKVLLHFYEELEMLLSRFPDIVAEMFVDRLTGYKNFGKSVYQLAQQYGVQKDEIQLQITAYLHYILETVEREKDCFPYLASIADDLSANTSLTKTAQATYQLLKNGMPVQRIARIRNLKINTIQDHIVEIALYDVHFPIEKYVSQADQQEIINAHVETNSYKLSVIKEHVPNRIDYFQIRLVLAVLNHGVKIGE